MADINLKTETPDTTLPTTGFLFGADSQAAASPSVYTTQAVATTLLGSTTLSGATITADAPVLNMSQTWNNAAVTFTGLKFNVVSDTSATASLLMDLQVGGASRFSVSKAGLGAFKGQVASGFGYSFGNPQFYDSSISANAGFGIVNPSQSIIYGNSTAIIAFEDGTNGVRINGSRLLGWVNGHATANAPDTILSRRGAANLRLGAADAAAPVAQTLSVQSVVAGTTNTAGANLTITGSQGTGTGAGGSIIFQVAPAGSSGSAQNALATALTIASTRDVTLANNLAVGNDISATGNVSVAAGSLFRFTNRGTMWAVADGVFQFSNNAAADFGRINFGGSTSSFPALKRSSTTLQARLADDTAFASVQGKLTTDTAYTAGSIVPTGYLTLYDSTGTAYRVPCVV